MIHAATLQFLKALSRHNNREWFEANREAYQQARTDVQQLAQTLISGIAVFDPSVAHLQPRDCLFRQHRDVRFSKNKQPFKTNMGISISAGGKKANEPGYYLHIEPAQSFVAGGMYMPDALQLQRIRQEIDYNFADWQQRISRPGFVRAFPGGVTGVQPLSRPPKGYTADNPALQYLKMRGFIMQQPVSDAQLRSPELVPQLLEYFNEMLPVIRFLQTALEG